MVGRRVSTENVSGRDVTEIMLSDVEPQHKRTKIKTIHQTLSNPMRVKCVVFALSVCIFCIFVCLFLKHVR